MKQLESTSDLSTDVPSETIDPGANKRSDITNCQKVENNDRVLDCHTQCQKVLTHLLYSPRTDCWNGVKVFVKIIPHVNSRCSQVRCYGPGYSDCFPYHHHVHDLRDATQTEQVVSRGGCEAAIRKFDDVTQKSQYHPVFSK